MNVALNRLAFGMAAAADDVRRVRFPFTIGAAIAAVLLGHAVTTWMGALFAVFHGFLLGS
jgi:ABC-type uncharacterized transport system permease subunit